MKEKPILFKAEMVRAILDGSKTQTRRVVKLPKSLKGGDLSSAFPDKAYGVTPCLHVPMPDGSIQRLRNPWGWDESESILLWVRETFMDLLGTGIEGNTLERKRYAYAEASPKGSYSDECRKGYGLKWKPSIFMPRAASSIQLEITNVRAERLNDISDDDALAEGVNPLQESIYSFQESTYSFIGYVEGYKRLWESINGAGSWEANPWVWVVEFKRV